MARSIVILFVLFLCSQAQAQWRLEAESGLAFQAYNDVRIPNTSATTFSFTDDFELQGPVIPLRLRLGYTFAEKNHLVVLYAPLAIRYEGPAPFDIQFQQTLFTEGQFIDGFYKFNSYRLTYRRDVLLTGRWTLGLGFTAKIRDARVQLSSNGLMDRKDDLGIVPLLHLYAAYQLNGWSAIMEGDGLAGGPGRAFDLFLGISIPLSESLALNAGYRLLEGGANVNKVYNFTLVNAVAAILVWKL